MLPLDLPVPFGFVKMDEWINVERTIGKGRDKPLFYRLCHLNYCFYERFGQYLGVNFNHESASRKLAKLYAKLKILSVKDVCLDDPPDTFGETAEGAEAWNNADGEEGTKYPLAVAGDVTSVSWFFDSNGARDYRSAIYDDDGVGAHPSTLQCESAGAENVVADAWCTSVQAVSLIAGDWWLMHKADGFVGINQQAGAVQQTIVGNRLGFGAFTNPYNAVAHTHQNWKLSVYATYTPVGVGVNPALKYTPHAAI